MWVAEDLFPPAARFASLSHHDGLLLFGEGAPRSLHSAVAPVWGAVDGWRELSLAIRLRVCRDNAKSVLSGLNHSTVPCTYVHVGTDLKPLTRWMVSKPSGP